MKYAYEDLSSDQFETLIILLCQRLLGIAVQGFAKGADGGRDAKFMGTAELYPSQANPWSGTVIIQAKHTNGYNKSFSEKDFYSESGKNTILGREIPKIKKLRESGQLDHYMLFANRKLSALSEEKIRKAIATHCHIPEESICLSGLEQLEMWMKRFPEIVSEANLDPVDAPLIVNPDDLAEIIEALADQKNNFKALLDDPPITPRTSYEKKNKLNNMTADYAKRQCHQYLKETQQIRDFLAAPENLELLDKYESVIDEFNFKIIAKRKDYQTFDDVMEYLLNFLYDRDPVIRQHKQLTRLLLFYMYWNCDIGKTDDAQTD